MGNKKYYEGYNIVFPYVIDFFMIQNKKMPRKHYPSTDGHKIQLTNIFRAFLVPWYFGGKIFFTFKQAAHHSNKKALHN